MPTVISHPAVALAMVPGLRNVERKPLVFISGVLLTNLPDLDVLAFRLGIPYGHMFGHRGFSHSIVFALLISVLFALINRQPSWNKHLLVWSYLFACAASHGLLDAITNGGLGVGFFIPFSAERYFFKFRPIQVSTLSFDRFINGQGIAVLQNELIVVWMPALVLFTGFYGLARTRAKA
jgi:inner membrane protein